MKQNKKMPLVILLTILIMISMSSCNMTDILEFQNEDNTVTGTVELTDRISEEAKNGADEVTLYVEDADENDIKNITGNMGLFWGAPTEYKILSSSDGTVKTKFYLEKSNNYYVIKNYLDGEEMPEENQQAKEILAALKTMISKTISEGMSDYEKQLAIHDWLVDHIEYDESIDAGSVENGSYGGLVTNKTMCRGYAEAMKLISECCGLETRVIVGDAIDANGNEVGHAWNLVNLDGKWYHMDATYDDPIGDDTGNIHYFYFNLNDADIGKDHSWESDYFPACNDDSYMYYKKNSLYYTNMADFKSGVTDALKYDKSKYIEVLLDADDLYESQLQFIFNVGSVRSVNWSTHSSNPTVVCISPNYY